MLAPGIKSRPVYPGLTPDPFAKHNLIVVEGEGAAAVLDMAVNAPPGFLHARPSSIARAGSAGKDYEGKLNRAFAVGSVGLPDADDDHVPPAEHARDRDHGARGFMRRARSPSSAVSSRKGWLSASISNPSSREHRGSAKRRVQCVHCKGFTEDVTTNPVHCAHCGLNLLVRDHYSRRLGAFQGVCIDAEVPGEAPAVEEIYK